MADIRAGILLSLKDKFSSEIKNAGSASQKFASTAMSAVNKVDKAFSGMTAKLGALGVSLSLGAASKDIIDIDARLTRMGMTADASAEQVNKLKQKIFEAAQDPNIKIDPSKIIDALDVVMTKTGSLEYVEDNIKNIAVALQATGESGESIGDVFSEFQKFGYDASSISQLMDDMVKQGDQGEYTFGKFAKTAKAVLSAYSPIGNSVEDTKKLGAVMQILIAGTKNEEAAVTSLDAIMSELSDPKKQEQLGLIGVAVRDSTGKFRDLADIMQDVLSVAEKEGNTDFLGEVFGMTSMKAVRAFQQYGKNYKKLTDDLGNTTGALEGKSARMAGTMKANLQNLQTTFLKFADANFAKPLEKLNDLLSYLSENPERMEKVFNTIKWGLAGIVAIKGISKVAGLIGSISNGIKGFKSGKMELAFGGGAASGMPVFVTNMGQGGFGVVSGGSPSFGAAGGMEPSLGGGQSSGGKQKLTFKQGAGIAGAAALGAAFTAIPAMIGELSDINNNPELKGKEKSKAKGGAIGAAAGSIGGAAAGALAGAAIGSVVPVVGTAIGALVGGGIGMLGGWLGRKAGEAIGEAVGKDDVIPESAVMREQLDQVQKLPSAAPTATLEGQAGIDINVTLNNDRTEITTAVKSNNAPFAFNTGRVVEARGAF